MDIKLINKAYGGLFVGVTMLFSCGGPQEGAHHTVDDKIREMIDSNAQAISDSVYYLDNLSELVKVIYDDVQFHVPERKGQIQAFACSECHIGALDKMSSMDEDKQAHWNVSIVHADASIMNCLTCHSENNMDVLHSLTGNTIDFNESFKLCGQCHNKQFDDWKGGAHGKQLGGWSNPRVSMTCVNCHNPHAPAFESRWPARYNTQKVIERQ
ncbi:MAG: cytochrome C [Flavobacteriales bacterium]|nr:cytochrome C [Flavobacteriales bacterium]